MKQIAKDNDAEWQSNTPAEKHAKDGPTSHRIVEPSFVEPMQDENKAHEAADVRRQFTDQRIYVDNAPVDSLLE